MGEQRTKWLNLAWRLSALLALLLTALAPATSSAFIPRQPLPLAADAAAAETRVRGIDSGVQDCTQAEEIPSLELHCEICLGQPGIASGFSVYANGNPLKYTDPSGQVAWQRDLARSLEREARASMDTNREYALSRLALADKFRQADYDQTTISRHVALPTAEAGLVIANITTVGPAMVAGAAGIGGGMDLTLQGAQNVDDYRRGYSARGIDWEQFASSYAGGGVMAPVGALEGPAATGAAVGFAGLGAFQAGQYAQKGEYVTAGTALVLGVGLPTALHYRGVRQGRAGTPGGGELSLADVGDAEGALSVAHDATGGLSVAGGNAGSGLTAAERIAQVLAYRKRFGTSPAIYEGMRQPKPIRPQISDELLEGELEFGRFRTAAMGARATALRSVSAQPPATALRPPPEPGGVAVVKVAAPMSPAPASCAPNGLGNSELEASAPRRSRRSGSPKSRAPRAASAPAGATSRSSRPG